jgi:hypothetical protein
LATAAAQPKEGGVDVSIFANSAVRSGQRPTITAQTAGARMMDVDPRDALLAITPPIKHYAELERLRLGMYRTGFSNKWLWNESEVRRLDVEVARRVIDLIKGNGL